MNQGNMKKNSVSYMKTKKVNFYISWLPWKIVLTPPINC